MNAASGTKPERVAISALDVAAGLGGSVAWATVTVVRVGAEPSALGVFAASFGCACLSGVPFVVVVRSLKAARVAIPPIVAASLAPLVPIALMAALIKQRTHHRALGAVTFATAATCASAFAYLVVRRLRALPESAVSRALRPAFAIACAASGAWLLWMLFRGLGHGAVREAVVDATVASGALGAAVWIPGVVVSPRAVRGAAAASLVVALLGWILLGKSAEVSAVLCERAPVTLGIAAIFACP